MKTAPLFRGKRIGCDEWVEGFFAGFVNNGKYGCISGEKVDRGYHVDPDTVEQIAGDVVEENAMLRDELERLKDIVCEEDVCSIEEALKEKK